MAASSYRRDGHDADVALVHQQRVLLVPVREEAVAPRDPHVVLRLADDLLMYQLSKRLFTKKRGTVSF